MGLLAVSPAGPGNAERGTNGAGLTAPVEPITAALDVPGSPPPVVTYTLRAELDTALQAVRGEGSITWTNTSRQATSELYLHLYLNAFKNAQTLFNRSPFTRARSGLLTQRFGSITLQRLSARELAGMDLLPSLEPHSPDDPLDETDRRVVLPRPIQPGEQLTLDVSWLSTLPDLVERTGVSRDFYFVGQWFPKLARLEADGSWAHFAFHPHAEFYSDFGDYEVTLDVPDAMRVGATGHQKAESRSNGRSTLVYEAHAVHDFAWTAWSGFEEQRERMGDVDVRLLYPAGNDSNARRTLAALRFALPHFSDRYGAYPYPDLTVVHPPRYAASAGGMEYPTLITTGGAWHMSLWSRGIETVTIHEFGHQWFYGLLASNEPRWPFLDEGLNSYAESVATETLFGAASATDILGFTLSSDALRHAGLMLIPHDAPIAQPASEFVSFQELGNLVYSRTALLFRTLGNVYGQGKLEEALRRYATRYRFRHPEPEDLLRVLGETLGDAAVENARAVLFRGAGVDYELRDLRSVQLDAPLPKDLLPGGTSPKPARIESRVALHRHGELELPIEVSLTTAAGEQIRASWDGRGRVDVISHVGDSPVVCAVADPEGRIAIEEDRLNNAVRQNQASPLETLDRSLYVFEWLLGLLAP